MLDRPNPDQTTDASPGEQVNGESGTVADQPDMLSDFTDALESRLRSLEQASAELLDRGLISTREATDAAEGLARSMETVGYTHAMHIARRIHCLIGDGDTSTQSGILQMSRLVVDLREEVEQAVKEVSQIANGRGDDGAGEGPTVLIASSDTATGSELFVGATAMGLKTSLVTDLAQVGGQAASGSPDAVVLDLPKAWDDERKMALDFLKRTAGGSAGVPVVVLSDSDSFAERLEVADLGGARFLPRSMPLSRALNEVDVLINQSQERQGRLRILVVVDDSRFSSDVEDLLESRDFEVSKLRDPVLLWESLEQFSPQMLVLDTTLPYLNSWQLSHVLRNDLRWRDLPIVLLTDTIDDAAVTEMRLTQVDQYVRRSTTPQELVKGITSTLRRSRMQNGHQVDPLTDTASRSYSSLVLNYLLSLARRHNQLFSLAIVDIDNLDAINERHGWQQGDAVLREVGQLLLGSFSSEEAVVGRWDDDEFIIGSYGISAQEGARRIQGAQEQIAESLSSDLGISESIQVSAGLAEHPYDGIRMHTLYRAAADSLAAAKSAGSGTVLVRGKGEADVERPERVDVVLVQEDQSLADPLQDTFQTQGFTTRWFNDGQTAVNALIESPPSMEATAVLLDLDLPYVDGMSVLRRMSEAGTLRRTHVIMLSARSGEGEMLQAFELRAFDYVPLPANIPLLVHRTRRALSLVS